MADFVWRELTEYDTGFSTEGLNQKWEYVEEFDKLSPYTDEMMDRGIEEYRKGLFCIKVMDEEGKPVENAIVRAKLKNHEFKFGANSFMLGMYEDPDMQKQWEEEYANIFNYTVAGVYWSQNEPEEGKYRFKKGSPFMYRRPPVDEVIEFAKKYNLRIKGHCLVFNTDVPDWAPMKKAKLKLALERYVAALAERYPYDFVDLDVVNELYWIYKNCYEDSVAPAWPRKMPICDEPDHIKWCFDLAKKYFPYSKLYWNEANVETFGFKEFLGDRSRRFMELRHYLNQGIPIEGMGIQCHLWDFGQHHPHDLKSIYNAYRMMEIFKVYEEFNLPTSISEITLPTYSYEGDNPQIQAELTKRLYKLWFSRKNMDSIVWWNITDGGFAFNWGNNLLGGLLTKDLKRKPSYEALDQLINHEWHTDIEMKTQKDGRVIFRGFYGDYDVEVSTDGKHYKAVRPFCKEETGYHHEIVAYRPYNLRECKVYLK